MLIEVMYCYTRLPNSIIKSQVDALYFIIGRRKAYLNYNLWQTNLAIQIKRINLLRYWFVILQIFF
jgi:hypothetical protein